MENLGNHGIIFSPGKYCHRIEYIQYGHIYLKVNGVKAKNSHRN